MKKQLIFNIGSKDAARELLSVNRGTLQDVHNVFRIDYKKPHAIIKMVMPTTRRAIRNAARDAGFPNADAVILFRKSYEHNRGYVRNNEFIVFTLSPAEYLDNPKRGGYDGFYDKLRHNSLDDAYGKNEFDELRKGAFYQGKTGFCSCYVILQDDADRTPEKQMDPLNSWTRYTVTGRNNRYGERTGWNVASLDRSERATVSRCYWYMGNKRHSEELEDVFDRSGYYVRDRRENLKKRAAALRAERLKNAYKAEDVTADVSQILTAAGDLKSAYAAAIANNDIMTAAAVIRFNFRNDVIRDALTSAARFIQKANTRDYKSRKDADDARERVLFRIAEASAQLSEILQREQMETKREEAKGA